METRVAIVTGASSGIGEELSLQLAQKGFAVLGVARRADRLAALAAREPRIHPFVADVMDEGAAEKIRAAGAALGEICWLVNNAGFGLFGYVARADPDKLVSMVRTNCEAPVALAAAIVPGLVAAKEGVVLNVASIAAFQAVPAMAVYAATKAFMLSWSESLSEELRGTGVSVSALCPGPVESEFTKVATYRVRSKPPGQITSAQCARFAIDAAERGVVIAIPGPLNRFAAVGSKLAPRAIVRRISGRVMRRYQSD